MSRKVDLSKPLSEFEVKYLSDRGRLPENYRADEEEFDLNDLEGASAWDQMTVEQLKGELRQRDLPVTGTRDELLDRLHESSDEDDFSDEE